MARNDFETSVESGQPVSLYLFRYGSGLTDFYAHTDGETQVSHDPGTGIVEYFPLAVEQLDSIESKQKQDQNEIKLKIPLDHEIAELFRIYPPTQVVTVTIREGHIPNTDDPVDWAAGENFPVAWTGRVLEVSREDSHVVLVCEAASASMLRPGLKRNYQWSCPFAVYHGRCGATKATYETIPVVASVTGNKVVLETPWVLAGRVQSDYIKGLAEWNGATGRHVRSVLRVDGTDTLVLSGPASELAALDTIDLYIGCTKFVEYCRDTHDAIQTYGGQPGIPTFNPVGKNNHT